MENSVVNLHEDKDVFEELIGVTAEAFGLPQVYVEKDYWVTKALKHLSESEHVDAVVFKGGTSLSKAYKLIDRFSEDIDLAIYANDLSGNVRKRLLKSVENHVSQGLKCLDGDERESKGSKYRKTVYKYPRSIDGEGFGQASPELLIEISAFTNPDPAEPKIIQTLITEVLLQINKKELIDQFDLKGFAINVLSAKRTLVEKMLGVIKDSYDDDPSERLSLRIRHLYDICLILKKEEYQDFVRSDEFSSMCVLCIEDEKAGGFFYKECLANPLSEAPLFSDFPNWRKSLESTYKSNFSDLVYGELPSMDDIEASLTVLHECLS